MNHIVVVLLVLSALFTLPLAAVGVSRRRTPGARPFVVLVVAVGAWSALNAVQIVALNPATKGALARLAYVCIVAVVIAWWSSCVQYAGQANLSSQRHLALASIPGLISLMLVAAGSTTTWMWTSLAVKAGPGPVSFPPGLWFVAHSAWAFTLVIGGLLVVARTMLRAPRTYRSQLIVLLVAIAIPLAVNAATVQSGLVDSRGHDLTPIATLVSAVVFGVGLLRFGLLDLAVGVVPIAHDAVVQSMRDGILIVGPDSRILEANAASVALLDGAVPPQVGMAVVDVLPGWSPLATCEVRHDPTGPIVEVSSSAIDDHRGYVITLRDVTEARAAESRLRQSFELASYQARHDHLTGLPNRRYLFDVLREQSGTYALLIVDLDGFKSVNDSHGHGAGDDVLSQLARRLRSTCRPDAVVARLGGDEFAVLLPGAAHADAELAARVAIGALSAPVMADGHEVALTASVGIALAPRHGTHSDELVRAADVAMYTAKRSHVRVAFYGVGDDTRSPDRVLLVQELRRAIGSGEIICHYQPQVLPNGVVRGAEALARWQHPDRGLLRPPAFLKAARHGGLMPLLSDRILEVAAAQLRAWCDAGRDWNVSVNLDAEDLEDPSLVERVGDALARAGAPAAHFGVEVTENAVFETSTGAQALEGVRRLGVSIALDDFGTGYGPLAHLRQLPIDQLKLDQSFVSGLTRDRRDAALVAGQIRIGHDLGLIVVAEGVESAASAHRLIELECDLLQGFHVGSPAPAADLRTAAVSVA